MNILSLGEPLAKGAEHRVYRYGGDQVVKVPAPWARLWQNMEPNKAQRDLDALKTYGISSVPTDCVQHPRLRLPDGKEDFSVREWFEDKKLCKLSAWT